MKKVTNYIVKSTNADFVERYILPEFRGRMNKLLAIAEERDYEPLIVIGKDGKWWNDELDFVLDRMSDGCCCYNNALQKWAKEMEKCKLKEGETRSILFEGEMYSVTGDTTDLSHDGVLTNDCVPIDEEV